MRSQTLLAQKPKRVGQLANVGAKVRNKNETAKLFGNFLSFNNFFAWFEGCSQNHRGQVLSLGSMNLSNFVGSLHLDIWESIDWRKVLKEITTRAYWNYQNALEIPLSDYVVPGTEHQDRIIATLCQLLKEAYNMNVDEQTHKVILEKKPSDV